MKKHTLHILATVSLMTLVGCGSSGSPASSTPPSSSQQYNEPQGLESSQEGFFSGYEDYDEREGLEKFPFENVTTVSFEDYTDGVYGDHSVFMRLSRQDLKEGTEALAVPENMELQGVFIDVLPGVPIGVKKSGETKADSKAIKAYTLHLDTGKAAENATQIVGGRPIAVNNIYVGGKTLINTDLEYIPKHELLRDFPNRHYTLNAGMVKIGGSAGEGKPSPLNPTFNEVFRSNHDDGIFYFATGSHVKKAQALSANQIYMNGSVGELSIASGANIFLGREYYATVDKMWHHADLTANLQLGFWPKEDRALMTVKEYSAISATGFVTKLGMVAENVLPNADEFSLMVMQAEKFSDENVQAPTVITSSPQFLKNNYVYTITSSWNKAKKAVIANFKREAKTDENSKGMLPVVSFKSIHEIAKKAALGLQNQLATSFNAMLTAGLHTTAQGVAAAPGVSRLSLQHDGANVSADGAVARFNVGGTNIMALGQAMTRHKATDGSGYGMALLAGKTLGENATQVTLFGGAQASMASGSKADDNMSVNLSEHRLDAVAGLSLRRSNAFYISAVGGVKLAATQNVNTQSMYMVDAPTFNTPTVFGALEASFNTTAGQLAASASTLGFNIGFKTGF